MKPTSGDGQNESRETPWPNVPKIASAEEFHQRLAVAQLAVNLCELEMAKKQTSLQKQNLDPAKFVSQAWKLIEDARGRVLRPQSNAEYLGEHQGSHEAL